MTYRVIWNLQLDPIKRAEIEAKIAAVRPAGKRRPHSYERARAREESRALAILQSPPVAPLARDEYHWIVRIYYTSQGNELLACDSAPLTHPGALSLCSQCPDAEVQRADRPLPLRSGARLVRLPSQHPDPVVTQSVVLGPDVTPILSGRPREGNFYHQAMARRAARLTAARAA